MKKCKEITPIAEPQYEKIITDPIHKCIRLTKPEYEILQLPAFNRLHNIHQLGLAYLVYPPGKTSRFEHSLGVTAIASKMICQLVRSTSAEELKELFNLNPNLNKFFKSCASLIQKVRMAALLHDVGHGPFSHVTEPFLLRSLSVDDVEEAKNLFQVKREHEIPVHAYFSYKMIIDKKSSIKKIIRKYQKNIGFEPEDVAKLLTKEKDISDDVKILRKIIASQLDADRMDNLLRDSHATGVPFGITDIDRVIHHLFIQKYKGDYELVVHERALKSVEDILDARFKMHKSIYNHHLVVALEEILRTAMDLMIDSEISPETFHFKRFLDGEVDDVYLQCKLRKVLNHGDTNQLLKTLLRVLFDRRYAPISLIKRPRDFDEFKDKIIAYIKKRAEKEVKKGIPAWLKEIKEGKIKFEHKDIKNVILIPVTKPFSPYAASKGEQIFIIEKEGGMPLEITEISTYIEMLNDEWEKFPAFRIFYIIPNVTKEKERKFKKRIVEQLIKSIGEYVKERSL